MSDTTAAVIAAPGSLTDPGLGVDLGRPVAGGVARLGRTDLAVTLSDLLEVRTYTTRLGSAAVRELVTTCGGVLLAVNPDDVTQAEHLEPVMAGDRSLLGWVELDTVRAARPKPAPVLTGAHAAAASQQASPDHR